MSWYNAFIGTITFVVLAAALLMYRRQAAELARQSEHLRSATEAATEQTTSLAHTSRVAASQTITDMMQAINTVFIQHPELHPCFYGSEPLPTSEPSRRRALIVSDMFMDLLSMTLDLEHEDVISQEIADSWRAFFRTIAANSEAMHEWWLYSRSWWESDVCNFMDSIYPASAEGA